MGIVSRTTTRPRPPRLVYCIGGCKSSRCTSSRPSLLSAAAIGSAQLCQPTFMANGGISERNEAGWARSEFQQNAGPRVIARGRTVGLAVVLGLGSVGAALAVSGVSAGAAKPGVSAPGACGASPTPQVPARPTEHFRAGPGQRLRHQQCSRHRHRLSHFRLRQRRADLRCRRQLDQPVRSRSRGPRCGR